MRKLENKVAVITGASTGIGAAIARLFAAEGAKLVVAARSLDKLETLARSLGPDAVALRTDMTKPAEIREMIERTVEKFGRLDILINNAGVGMYSAFADTPPERLEHLVAVNWLGPAHAIQAAIPHMRKQGSGQIINISSVSGKIALPWMGAYCSTKSALNALSYSLRMELEDENIRVISVCPGRVETPFIDNAIRDASTRPFLPGGISPERVARAVLRASLSGAREIVVPASNWAYVWLHGILPDLADRVMVTVLRRSMRGR